MQIEMSVEKGWIGYLSWSWNEQIVFSIAVPIPCRKSGSNNSDEGKHNEPDGIRSSEDKVEQSLVRVGLIG